MTALDRVLRALDDRGVPFALIGAAALAVKGIARSTYDIDVLVMSREVLVASWWDALREAGTEIDLRRGDSDDPLAGVVRVQSTSTRPVDIVVGKHAWQARAIARADRFTGMPPVVSTCDLILLKLYAGGTQDLWDIRELLRLPGAERLIEDVEADLTQMSLSIRRLWTDVSARG
jgi:hypothetical protein